MRRGASRLLQRGETQTLGALRTIVSLVAIASSLSAAYWYSVGVGVLAPPYVPRGNFTAFLEFWGSYLLAFITGVAVTIDYFSSINKRPIVGTAVLVLAALALATIEVIYLQASGNWNNPTVIGVAGALLIAGCFCLLAWAFFRNSRRRSVSSHSA